MLHDDFDRLASRVHLPGFPFSVEGAPINERIRLISLASFPSLLS